MLGALRARAAALVAGDAAALTALLHPALVWTTHAGAVLDRDAYVAGNTGGGLTWLAQHVDDARVTVTGGTAVVTGTVVDEVSRDGAAPETFRLRWTTTWVRSGAGWVCLAGHAGPRLPAD